MWDVLPNGTAARVIGAVLTVPVIFATCMAGASDQNAGSRILPQDPRPRVEIRCPTDFDYVVLASLADASNFHAMAGYRHKAYPTND